ncbi:MFS transporter [Salipaludibacillus agaradhaerens]|uniref:MFS transporter n=1 Tax=Salipaludibacillus agaradhaerens TaxID=76935 RepID=UPI0021507A53|nr:MFS transporter [Salipaludibacillus agaradhaerens]MCR6107779.1 MFS transporter [Salipaludibacillus agaradhaerens]MCR6119808.1 MFS transporter [Salipaludibacillus agaradhaerens]
MTTLKRDTRLFKMLATNMFSSMGSGMTMIAVPWLFVTKDGGETVFGYVTLCVTILLFMSTPFIGNLIDQVSRKRLLIAGEMIGLLIIMLFTIAGFSGVSYTTWHFVILFITGSFYYNLFYPTIFAFNQEIFEPSQYKTLNGVMEVQGQLAAVLSGGLAALLLPIVEFKWLLLLNAMTYAIAVVFFSLIPYKKMPKSPIKDSFWRKLTEGYVYMMRYPRLFLFLVASFMPFIGVMMTNYLFPVYIDNILQAGASVYGMKTMVYGIGAVLAGIFLPIILKRVGNESTIVFTVLLFAVSITLYIFFPFVSIFYLLTVLIAFGNAGTRVARNSLIMERIPNDKIGRVDSLFRGIGLGTRIMLLSLFTQMVAVQNVILPFQVLSTVLFISFIIITITLRHVIKEAPVKSIA